MFSKLRTFFKRVKASRKASRLHSPLGSLLSESLAVSEFALVSLLAMWRVNHECSEKNAVVVQWKDETLEFFSKKTQANRMLMILVNMNL